MYCREYVIQLVPTIGTRNCWVTWSYIFIYFQPKPLLSLYPFELSWTFFIFVPLGVNICIVWINLNLCSRDASVSRCYHFIQDLTYEAVPKWNAPFQLLSTANTKNSFHKLSFSGNMALIKICISETTFSWNTAFENTIWRIYSFHRKIRLSYSNFMTKQFQPLLI